MGFGTVKHLTSELIRRYIIIMTPEYCAPKINFKVERQIYQTIFSVFIDYLLTVDVAKRIQKHY